VPGLPGRPGLPWSLLVPSGCTVVELPGRGKPAIDRLLAGLQCLPAGSSVLLLDGRAGSRTRLRAMARAGGLDVVHEYVVLPRLASALFVMDDDPATVRWVCRSVLTVPPGTTVLAAPVDLAVRLLRAAAPWWLLGRLAPGRALVGLRP
jgi:hypothetical protein